MGRARSVAGIARPTCLQVDLPYTIQRRPAPAINAREVALPSKVVIDLTTWGTLRFCRARLNSWLPVNIYTGFVDVLVYPNGTVVPTTIYSTPASFGMSASFFHFWLAERSDVVAVNLDRERPSRAHCDRTAAVSADRQYPAAACSRSRPIVALRSRVSTGSLRSSREQGRSPRPTTCSSTIR